MRPLVEEYMVTVEQLFVILAARKSDTAVSLNPPLQGNWFHVKHYLTFWQHENVIPQVL
jgi:hypothetical protein